MAAALVAALELEPAFRSAGKQQPCCTSKSPRLCPGAHLYSLVTDAFAPIRFTMALLVALAVLGTVVAAGGLYALTAYSVSQSTPDLAVRMAMGASSGAIIG